MASPYERINMEWDTVTLFILAQFNLCRYTDIFSQACFLIPIGWAESS
jgi:hypothetical protein